MDLPQSVYDLLTKEEKHYACQILQFDKTKFHTSQPEFQQFSENLIFYFKNKGKYYPPYKILTNCDHNTEIFTNDTISYFFDFNISEFDDDQTVTFLGKAVLFSAVKIVRYFLINNALSKLNKQGLKTIRLMAAACGSNEIIRLLEQAGLNFCNSSSVNCSIIAKRSTISFWMITNFGAWFDGNLILEQFNIPLFYHLIENSQSMVYHFPDIVDVKYKSFINIVLLLYPDFDFRPLYSRKAISVPSLNLKNQLGVQLSTNDSHHKSAVIRAAMKGDIESLRYLINCGYKLKDPKFHSLKFINLFNAKPEILKILKTHNTNDFANEARWVTFDIFGYHEIIVNHDSEFEEEEEEDTTQKKSSIKYYSDEWLKYKRSYYIYPPRKMLNSKNMYVTVKTFCEEDTKFIKALLAPVDRLDVEFSADRGKHFQMVVASSKTWEEALSFVNEKTRFVFFIPDEDFTGADELEKECRKKEIRFIEYNEFIDSTNIFDIILDASRWSLEYFI